MLRRNGPVVKSVESVLRLEGSLWGERFVEEVGRGVHYCISSMIKHWWKKQQKMCKREYQSEEQQCHWLDMQMTKL